MSTFLAIKNCQPVSLHEVPVLEYDAMKQQVAESLQAGCRISAFCALPDAAGAHPILLVLLNPQAKSLEIAQFMAGESYPSLTCDIPAFHWFERELHETTGILPEGHPWLKPIRFSAPAKGGERPEIGVTDYFTLAGDSAHEVAVGPVHAGVIEPGHFRFQCLGEDVLSLEIELGYQHRGIEALLKGGPDGRTRHFVETASGDTSIAQALCYHGVLEALGHCSVNPRARKLRTLALELERIANHIGDLGALAGDVAYLPTASYCGRIRGDFLNMTATLCGNRFGRGYVTPGSVRFALDEETRKDLLARLDAGEAALNNALALMFDEPTVLDRFENTGTVTAETAADIGLVGMAARASGLPLDSRADLKPCIVQVPAGFKAETVPAGGDVLARAQIRRQELAVSLKMVRSLLQGLADEASEDANESLDYTGTLPADTLCVSIVEAWRGELCHVALTGAEGRFAMYKIVDPSFHNWFGLAMALRNQQISDFPICNKSFNLSYCGHDL